MLSIASQRGLEVKLPATYHGGVEQNIGLETAYPMSSSQDFPQFPQARVVIMGTDYLDALGLRYPLNDLRGLTFRLMLFPIISFNQHK
jgi:hypothetical protein